MIYSKYQEAIFQWIRNQNDGLLHEQNLVIEATAGSGKTTTLVENCKYIAVNQKTILVSFSRAIADVLATKIPRHVESNTLNAHGWRICRDNVRGVILDKFKDVNIFKQYVEEKDWYKWKSLVAKLVSLMKNNLVTPFNGNMINVLNQIRDQHALDFPDKIKNFYEIVEKVYIESVNQKDIMSFDDQKYMPIYCNWSFPQYNWVMVDEAQDLSLMEVEFINRMGEKKVFVGDRYQSIYLFKGSDSDAMDNIVKRFEAKELPLSICYRCPTAVINEAKGVNQTIEHPEVNSNGEGLVETINKNKYEVVVQEGDFVLCRTTAPLIKYCLRMLSLKKRAYVKGREIGEGLIKLIDTVCNGSINMRMEEFQTKLDTYFSERLAHLNNLNREDQATLLEDQVEGLKALMVECVDVNALKYLINEIIVDRGIGICFMTLHKSKGLENPNVFIIRRDLIPHKLAKTEAQLKQENNLLFIGITRSQQTLRYVTKDVGEK